jgi:hypothetical protein
MIIAAPKLRQSQYCRPNDIQGPEYYGHWGGAPSRTLCWRRASVRPLNYSVTHEVRKFRERRIAPAAAAPIGGGSPGTPECVSSQAINTGRHEPSCCGGFRIDTDSATLHVATGGSLGAALERRQMSILRR